MKLKSIIGMICATLLLTAPALAKQGSNSGVGDLMSQFAHDKKIYEEKLEAMDGVIAKAEEKQIDSSDMAELKQIRGEFASWLAPAEAAAHAGDNETYYALKEDARQNLEAFKAKARDILWNFRKERALERFDAIVANWTERIDCLSAAGGDVTQLQKLLDEFKGYRDDLGAASNATEVREIAVKLREILANAREEAIKIKVHILVDIRAPPVLANATDLLNFLKTKGANSSLVSQAETQLAAVQGSLNEAKVKIDGSDFEGAKTALKQAHETWKEFKHTMVQLLRELGRWR